MRCLVRYIFIICEASIKDKQNHNARVQSVLLGVAAVIDFLFVLFLLSFFSLAFF